MILKPRHHNTVVAFLFCDDIRSASKKRYFQSIRALVQENAFKTPKKKCNFILQFFFLINWKI